MGLLLLFAFLSGVVTIFAPCIWPILPIVLSAGVTGGERRPMGIVVGLMFSFTVFTLTLSYILKVIPLDPDTLRLSAVAVISLFGLTLVVPALGRKLEALVSRLSSLSGGLVTTRTGFKGGFLTGFALGIVWSPCAGPILATVATVAATQTLTLSVVLVTVAFVLGVGVPLFVVALLGRHMLTRTKALSPYTGRIQQAFGILMIFSAVAIYTGYDQVLQVRFAEFCSSNGITLFDRFQTNTVVTTELERLRTTESQNAETNRSPRALTPGSASLPNLGPAPEFSGIMNWLNVDQPLTLSALRGKVVLVDFWTYSCVNCLRTLPSLTAWYEKYRGEGLVIVGVHTPEFEFEKKTANVASALTRYGITYPVAQDNSYGTWQAYHNRYWPAHYLIDGTGAIRAVHFGEGNYAETERAIQELLAETGQTVSPDLTDMATETASAAETPETYLGSRRLERLASPERVTGLVQTFTTPSTVPVHHFAYSGKWQVTAERAEATPDATLDLHFQGKKVFLVMAPLRSGVEQRVQVWLDGAPLTSDATGADVRDGSISVNEGRLYEVIDLKGTVGEHRLQLRFLDGGVAAYAFTFS